MRIEFVAHMDDDESIKVVSDARDLRRWEAEYKRTMVGEGASLTYLTQLAYIAMRRQRVLNGKYATYALFDEACIDLEIRKLGGDDDQVVADPTPSAATADS